MAIAWYVFTDTSPSRSLTEAGITPSRAVVIARHDDVADTVTYAQGIRFDASARGDRHLLQEWRGTNTGTWINIAVNLTVATSALSKWAFLPYRGDFFGRRTPWVSDTDFSVGTDYRDGDDWDGIPSYCVSAAVPRGLFNTYRIAFDAERVQSDVFSVPIHPDIPAPTVKTALAGTLAVSQPTLTADLTTGRPSAGLDGSLIIIPEPSLLAADLTVSARPTYRPHVLRTPFPLLAADLRVTDDTTGLAAALAMSQPTMAADLTVGQAPELALLTLRPTMRADVAISFAASVTGICAEDIHGLLIARDGSYVTLNPGIREVNAPQFDRLVGTGLFTPIADEI